MSDRTPRKVEVLRRRTLLSDFLTVEDAELRYERYDGHMSPPLRRLCLERGDAAAAVLWNRERGTVLLVEQFRYPTWVRGTGWLIEVVAGMLEPGEAPETALRREIHEETGHEALALEELGWFFASPGGSSQRLYLYLAEIDGAPAGEGGGMADEGEDIRLVELPLAEVWRRLDAGELHDAKTLVALWQLRWRLHGTPSP